MVSSESTLIRKLPAGGSYTGILSGCDGNRVRLTPEAGDLLSELRSADLVEITSLKTIYLGEVLYRQGKSLIVSVEHSIDRAALQAIQQVWQPSQRE